MKNFKKSMLAVLCATDLCSSSSGWLEIMEGNREI